MRAQGVPTSQSRVNVRKEGSDNRPIPNQRRQTISTGSDGKTQYVTSRHLNGHPNNKPPEGPHVHTAPADVNNGKFIRSPTGEVTYPNGGSRALVAESAIARSIPILDAVTLVTGVMSGRISTESPIDFMYNAAGFESPSQQQKREQNQMY